MTHGAPRPRSGNKPGWLPGGDQVLVSGEQVPFRLVGDQEAGGLAGIDVQSGDAPCVVVSPHQPGALLVGVEEGLCAGAGIRHVGHVLDADPFGVRGVLVGGRDPLVRGAVTDPRGDTTVQVQDGPVLREAGALAGSIDWLGVRTAHRVTHCVGDALLVGGHVHGNVVGVEGHHLRPDTRTHEGGVDRQEQISGLAVGEQVAEQHPHRPVLLSQDGRAEVARDVDAERRRRR